MCRRKIKMVNKNIRKVATIAGLVLCCVSDGFIFGQMSGMINALAAPDSDILLTETDISWIVSTIHITCACGYIIVGVLSRTLGRRLSASIIGVPILLCWILLYVAQDKLILILTRIIVGISYGGVFFQTIINCGEYLPPNRRQFGSNLIISIGTLTGTMMGHILSLLFNWRSVALVGLIPSGLACILPLFSIESPYWLATKGKFEKSKKAFKDLRNPDDDGVEIKDLIEYEMKNQREFVSRHDSRLNDLKKSVNACKQIYFWKITLLIIVVNIYRAVAGRVLLDSLAITMLQEITDRSDILMFTVIVDGFGMIGAAASFDLINKFKMRTLLFTSAIISHIILVFFSASLYYVPNESWYPWIKIIILAFYYIVASAGPYAVLNVFIGEVHPLEIKEFSSFVSGSLGGVIYFLFMKLASTMFSTFGYSGTFLINNVIISICLVYLWFYMPETKGRTLQEIEMFFKTGEFECTRVG